MIVRSKIAGMARCPRTGDIFVDGVKVGGSSGGYTKVGAPVTESPEGYADKNGAYWTVIDRRIAGTMTAGKPWYALPDVFDPVVANSVNYAPTAANATGTTWIDVKAKIDAFAASHKATSKGPAGPIAKPWTPPSVPSVPTVPDVDPSAPPSDVVTKLPPVVIDAGQKKDDDEFPYGLAMLGGAAAIGYLLLRG